MEAKISNWFSFLYRIQLFLMILFLIPPPPLYLHLRAFMQVRYKHAQRLQT